MKPPAKRITSTDVARAAGVSQTTVSLVLNNKPGQRIPTDTRRRVLEAARQLNYRPRGSARTLAAGRSNVVLLALSGMPISPSVSGFIEHFGSSLATRGLTLVTHLVASGARALEDVSAAVDASAVVGLEPFDEPTAEALHQAGVDLVLAVGADFSPPQKEIGRLQARHLLDRGHRRIGYALPERQAFRSWAEERLHGVLEVCAERGVDPAVAQPTGLDDAEAAQAVAAWRRQSVTGVCAYNDEIAIAVLAGLRAHGLTAPDDLAVVGVDDIPVARLAAPPLTTIAFDLGAAGARLAEVVAAGLDGGDVELSVLAPGPQLLVRGSA
ncbi:LacI family DNA-binding transcriptional regulator [Streptomyces lomondensis]|uniref:LacI family transcriptional regulator n=1 Tax=Streptomyces lomondensis TaxID=68229 RepID=A0ABQ2XRP2_9ACTN|nr:LacI family DNA-binding transcriptional regulator [Streptomyces lomondensis]MCF0080876.1 LacI family transcriptional regulator [Streptomyces lomondensis]GGX30962.1 LacI family transcriptional regulator [Streptomyces lomondensis]